MKNIIIIGRICKGRLPIGGETAKNQNLSKALSRFCNVIELDYYNNHKRPWIFLQTLWAFVVHPKASIILSTSANNIYPLLRLFKLLGVKRNVIHWIIGGQFDKLVEKGRFDINVLNVASFHLAESHTMVCRLQKSGLQNVKHIPNFRQIPYVPDLNNSLKLRCNDKITRFIFLSRIMESKGVSEILDCACLLNHQGFENKYQIDFYGRIDESYTGVFENRIKEISNVNYCGILDLRNNTGYDTLSTYHAMLFPTHHPSEGMAGVLVDAMVAGVPVITSDWGHNSEIIKDGINGIIIPAKSIDALSKAMVNTIDGRINLSELSKDAQRCAEKYDASKVITQELLQELNIF